LIFLQNLRSVGCPVQFLWAESVGCTRLFDCHPRYKISEASITLFGQMQSEEIPNIRRQIHQDIHSVSLPRSRLARDYDYPIPTLEALSNILCKLSDDRKLMRIRGSATGEYDRVTYSAQQKRVILSLMETYFRHDRARISRQLTSNFLNTIRGYDRITPSILRRWIIRRKMEESSTRQDDGFSFRSPYKSMVQPYFPTAVGELNSLLPPQYSAIGSGHLGEPIMPQSAIADTNASPSTSLQHISSASILGCIEQHATQNDYLAAEKYISLVLSSCLVESDYLPPISDSDSVWKHFASNSTMSASSTELEPPEV
jgi:hypothetical protein